MACPVCYQDYVMGQAEGETVPRQLPCGDVTCTMCLRDVLVDSALVCQLCLKTYSYADVTEIPVWTGIEEHSDTESTCSDASDISYTSYSDTDDTGSDTSDRSPRQSMSPTGGSKLTDFMEATASAAGRPVRRGSGDDKKPTKSCTIPGCPNRRGPRGYCSSHSHSTHLNAESAKRATRKLERAKLSRLTFKPGDRIKEMKDSESASPWGRVDSDELAARFKRHELLELGEVLELIDQSRQVLMKEPNVLQVQAPVTAVGDIHGQFFDLLHLIENGGKPGEETTYLFLGDYVDRGKYSCEVILYLLALKVQYPKRVFLIRGNHESRGTTGYFGFKEECKAKYGLPVYYRFLLCFECLPLCALIQTSYGRIFACHGGISPDIATIDEIETINRFVEPECKGALCDILWSDPLHESVAEGDERFEEFMSVEWKPNYERGCSFYFGYRAVRRFLDDNELLCIVRAHQVQEEGYRRHFYSMDPLQRPGSPLSVNNVRQLLPPVITIFSAPNYVERYQNKAAFLRIGLEPNELSFEQFDCVPTSSLPTGHGAASLTNLASAHHLAITSVCPYMPTTFRELFKVAMELGSVDAPPPACPSSAIEPPLSSVPSPSSSSSVSPGPSDDATSPESRRRTLSPPRSSPTVVPSRRVSLSPPPSSTSPSPPTRGKDGGVIGGRRETKCASPSRTFFYSDPGRTLSASRSWEDGLAQNSGCRTAAGGGGKKGARKVGGLEKDDTKDDAKDDSKDDSHQRISVIRSPARNRARAEERPKSSASQRKGTVTLKREMRSEAIKTRSSLYMLAAARDGINEMHPEILEKRMQVIAAELQLLTEGEDMLLSAKGGRSEGCHDAHFIEGRRFSVSELCRRFEKGMLDEKLEDIALSEDEDDLSAPRHRRHASLDNLKLTAASVTELRDFFELLSRKNAERRQGDRPSSGVRRFGTSGPDAHAPPGRKGSRLGAIPEAGAVAGAADNLSLSTSSLGSSGRMNMSSSGSGAVAGGQAGGSSNMGTPTAPEMFTHDEIVTLRLIFSLFDDNGDDYVDMQELVRYSEETGDYALPHQAMECIRVIDCDGDGRIGLWDYIHFAARLKELHRANQHALVMCEIKKRSLVKASATV